jgi:hypothetical protein
VWLAPRAEGGEALLARSLVGPDRSDRLVADVAPPGSLGRPVLNGDRVLFHIAGRLSSRILEHDLAAGATRTVRSGARALLLNPSVQGDRIAYVRALPTRQELRVGSLAGTRVGSDRVLYRALPTGRGDAGYERGRRKARHNNRRIPPRPRPGVHVTLWTTALDARYAYVTRLVARTGKGLSSTVLRTELPVARKRR